MNNEKELRLLTALTEIYNNSQEKTQLNISNVLKKNRVSYTQKISKIIKDNSIIIYSLVGTRRYVTWNTIKPNLKMVQKIYEILDKANKDSYSNIKNANKKVNEVISIKESDLRHTNPNELNTFSFLNKVYSLTKDDFVKINRRELCARYKVTNERFAKEYIGNYLTLEGKFSKWNKGIPTLEMAKQFNDSVREFIKKVKQKQILDRIKNINTSEEDNENYEVKSEKVNELIEETNNLKQELKQREYKKTFKLFGITIFSTTIVKNP